jgi:tetratricopeptide (TPR) repeat protein
LQDSYFSQKDAYDKEVSLIKEEVLPNVKNKICKVEDNKNSSNEKTIFVSITTPSSEAYLKMANARYRVGNLRIAIKEINRSIAINPLNSFAYNLRGKILMSMGYLNSALVDFDKAIKLNPEETEFYIHRVDILLKKDLYTQALSDFDKIISLDPKSNIWFLRRGLLKIKQSKYDEALADISKYITFEKNNSLAYRSRGIIYLNFGNFDKACSDLSISKNLNDNKTEKLLKFINSKNPDLCNSTETKTSNNSNSITKKENVKELNVKKVCDKNTFVKFDDKESCFY